MVIIKTEYEEEKLTMYSFNKKSQPSQKCNMIHEII